MFIRGSVIAAACVAGTSAGDCLCIFDVDRTLTGRQGETAKCPGNYVQSDVQDPAYDGGVLTLSHLTQGVAKTFCNSCYLGVISAGTAGGDDSAERGVLHDRLEAGTTKRPLTKGWNPAGCTVTSPLVTSCTDGQKQTAVPGIIEWYKTHNGAQIADSDVHFFDDRSSNVIPFQGLGYNARQISCRTRDGEIGLCGAELHEIVATAGVQLCPKALEELPTEHGEVFLAGFLEGFLGEAEHIKACVNDSDKAAKDVRQLLADLKSKEFNRTVADVEVLVTDIMADAKACKDIGKDFAPIMAAFKDVHSIKDAMKKVKENFLAHDKEILDLFDDMLEVCTFGSPDAKKCGQDAGKQLRSLVVGDLVV